MYTFAIQNPNYITEIKKERNDLKKSKDLAIEIMKKKEKLNNFNPKDLFDSEVSDSSINDSNNSKLNKQTKSYALQSNMTNKTYDSAMKKTNGKGNLASRKINLLKKVVKWIDLISIILILSGCILSQCENINYQTINKNRRTAIVLIANCIRMKIFSNLNITFINQTFINENINNLFLLNNFNTNVKISEIKFELLIDDYCKICRKIILLLAIISLFFLFISRYYEFKRQCIYKEKLDIPFTKSKYLNFLIIEILIILPIQFPKINSYFLYRELGTYFILPLSTILSSLSLQRMLFSLKFVKSFSF